MKRRLGRSGIDVSAMGFGCWAIGGQMWAGETPIGWGEVDDHESIKAIHCAIDHGVNFFDTANVYGAGHSERVLAKALEGHRDKVVIATKFGNNFDEETRQALGSDASPAFIRQSCEDSLRRLNIETIDLYQFHINGYDPALVAPVLDTLDELVKTGKIRYYGWSTDFPERAEAFAKRINCTAIQHQLNVLDDKPEILEVIEKFDLASINRGPLAMGLLTGKYTLDSVLPSDDVRGKNSPDWMSFFKGGKPSPEFLKNIETIKEILTSQGRSLVQGALAWIWGRSERTIPIPGIRTTAQAEENAGAMAYGPLTPDQIDEIDQILGR